jgi:ADP-dependent NAD(P)H-hydrate dehydratase
MNHSHESSSPSADSRLPQLPPRRPDSHKGDFGLALLIGGSCGMSGAIALAGMAALRSGAGLVKLAVPDACLDVVSSHEPSYMTAPLPCDPSGRIDAAAWSAIATLAASATCVAIGPGLGRCESLTALVGQLYTTLPQPLVVDADALNALAQQPDILRRPGGPRVLTPHPGEFRRLLGDHQRQIPAASFDDQAVQLAAAAKATIVLKGHRTLITDGSRAVRNATGNPGMATGGSGDVLTGVLTALICQGLAPFEAAQLGVHVHGLAGDLAATQLGQISLIASDLLRFLPAAFQQMTQTP